MRTARYTLVDGGQGKLHAVVRCPNCSITTVSVPVEEVERSDAGVTVALSCSRAECGIREPLSVRLDGFDDAVQARARMKTRRARER